MKKKLALFIFIGMSLCVTACGGSSTYVGNLDTSDRNSEQQESMEKEDSSDEEEKSEEEDTVEDEKSSEEEDSIEEKKKETLIEVKEEDTEIKETISEEDRKETLDIAKLEQMMNDTLNWIGLQYFYKEDPNIKELTVAQALPMAYNAIGASEEKLEEDNEWNLIIPEELLQETMKNLFGKVYDISEYIPEEHDMVRQAEDGSFRLVQGDWGSCVPRFSLGKLEHNKSSNEYILAVEYYTYDWDEDVKSDTEYVVHYYLTLDAESSYGVVITNMIGEKVIASETEILSEKSYTDEELCNMAREYYIKHTTSSSSYVPSIIEVDRVTEEGEVMIHLYDIVDNHTATCDWYWVDRTTAKGTNIMGEEIDLTK